MRIFWMIVILVLCSSGAPVKQKWTRDMYAKHDYKSFAQLPMARQPIDVHNIDYALLNAAIFYATNWQRDKHRRKPFQHSPALEKAAFEHSKDMIQYDFFSHESPLPNKQKFWQRLKAEGVSGGASSENIAMHSNLSNSYLETAKALVLTWMDSPGHRSNILNESYKYLGCGAYIGKYKGWSEKIKATQNFSTTDAPNSKEIVIDYK